MKAKQKEVTRIHNIGAWLRQRSLLQDLNVEVNSRGELNHSVKHRLSQHPDILISMAVKLLNAVLEPTLLFCKVHFNSMLRRKDQAMPVHRGTVQSTSCGHRTSRREATATLDHHLTLRVKSHPKHQEVSWCRSKSNDWAPAPSRRCWVPEAA